MSLIILIAYIYVTSIKPDLPLGWRLRLIRYIHDKQESFGILKDNEVIDLPSLLRMGGYEAPDTLEALVSSGLITEIHRLINDLPEAEVSKINVEKIVLRAPILCPPKIICLGLNYRDHAEESGAEIPDEPIIFMKPRTSIIGHEEPIVKPIFVKKLDYEAELAMIIAKRGKNISISEAADYIFGYTAFNDVSARDIQFKDGQWTRGKSLDTFAPIGPCITTSDQIGDPMDLKIMTRVNGEVRQNSSTRNMIFNVYEIIYHLSRIMTLEPCDIIATGTPGGVAAFMKPKPKFLKAGDIVEIEIEGIGTLRNPVIEE